MLEDRLVELLIKNNLHISFYESCTGGMLAARIINVSNASKVLNESLVTYSNEAKMKYLKVNPLTIEKYDVVSEEVAKEMVVGGKLLTKSEVNISTTGVAGPTGGTDLIPVGTVCFGILINDKLKTFKKNFNDIGRNKVREEATNFILEKAIKLLEEYYEK